MRRCRDALSVLVAAVETAARTLGERLAAPSAPGPARTLVHLQVADLTVQRCAHSRDALTCLDAWEQPDLLAPGCRLQAMQLARTAADFRAGVEALLAGLPEGLGSEASAGVAALAGAVTALDATAAAVHSLAETAAPISGPDSGPDSDQAAALRAAVVERLKPAYSMAGERAILARFLAGDTGPDPDPAPASDSVEEFFL